MKRKFKIGRKTIDFRAFITWLELRQTHEP